MGKLKNDDMIAISVLDSLASCAKIDTRNNTAASNANLKGAFYNAANTPVDAFGCSKNTCYNTGTYQGAVVAKAAVTIGDFKKTFDTTLYATGIITVYVLLPDGDHRVSVNLTDYAEGGWANFDALTKTVHATKGGNGSYLYPVQFDLSKAPTETGTGWTPSTIGVKARFVIDGANLKVGDYVGVSSIAFYESIEDLELNRTILLSCLDTFGDSQSFDVIEGACSTSEYDPQSGSITFNLTANKWSENLNTSTQLFARLMILNLVFLTSSPVLLVMLRLSTLNSMAMALSSSLIWLKATVVMSISRPQAVLVTLVTSSV